MSWVGKAVGGLLGLAVGSAPGALVGVALGHAVDSGLERLARDLGLPFGDRQRMESAFFSATFSVMGHLAKADGRVSEAEIAIAERIMARLQLSGERRSAAIALFRQGKAPGFDLAGVISRFRRECLGRRMLLQLFLDLQLQAAYAEGEPSPAKRRVLEQIRVGLGVSPLLFGQMEKLVRIQRRFADAGASGQRTRDASGAGWGGQWEYGRDDRRRAGAGRRTSGNELSLSEAYSMLGVSATDSDAVIKRAYRKLLSQNHPDKLASKGLPDDMLRLATQKTTAIRRAYETIQATRAA